MLGCMQVQGLGIARSCDYNGLSSLLKMLRNEKKWLKTSQPGVHPCMAGYLSRRSRGDHVLWPSRHMKRSPSEARVDLSLSVHPSHTGTSAVEALDTTSSKELLREAQSLHGDTAARRRAITEVGLSRPRGMCCVWFAQALTGLLKLDWWELFGSIASDV